MKEECKAHLGHLKVKHLIVYCHPNSNSLSAAYKDEVVRITERTCHDVIVRDLYNIRFCPTLSIQDLMAFQNGDIPDDLKVERDYISWADLITFIYPVWWTGLPAMVKGYIDRVFAYGFAYAQNEKGQIKKLLTGKKVVILNNMSQPFDYYKKIGMIDSMKQTCDNGIFSFCGMEVVEHRFFGNVLVVSEEERRKNIDMLKQVYREVLPDNSR